MLLYTLSARTMLYRGAQIYRDAPQSHKPIA